MGEERRDAGGSDPGCSTDALSVLGSSVRAVDTKQHERRIIEERLSEGKPAPGSTESAEGDLEAVKREIQAVREIVEDLQSGSQGDSATLMTTLVERLKELKKEKKRLLALKSGRSKPKVSFKGSSLDSVLNSKSRLLETERDKLVRTGVLTPFDRMKGFERKQKNVVKGKARGPDQGKSSQPRAKRLDISELPPREDEIGTGSKFNWREKRKRITKSNIKASKSLKADAGMGCITEADTESEDEHLGESQDDDVVFDGGYRQPSDRWQQLFDYQRTGIKWMWELHNQGAGGVLGDEMGLGKTVQVIAFLDGLLRSGMYNTSIIVCPVTLMSHWAREFRRWAPDFKVFVLHESAYRSNQLRPSHNRGPMPYRVINAALKSSRGVLVTSYEQLRLKQDQLLGFQWGYAILDEGHKIRNPNIELTLVCKQLSTPHRLILTGAPIQNRLVEIWSLFDFVFPGKLGSLPVFTTQFSIPIQAGGYAHASKLQVTASYKCALILRDLINPYLLRRKKRDVNINLPEKKERAVFCQLGKEQLELYRDYLASHDCTSIMEGKIDPLAGIDTMKKICNHPDLLDMDMDNAAKFGDVKRSGKLSVLMTILERWCSGGHKILVFSQTRQMLNIIEDNVRKMDYRHLRMDGTTAIHKRQALVDTFNETEDIKVFCLTTRVGGLGLNLTGADRVILYDPDWNPSTDLQAQERSWRIGQKNEVVVFRLVTSGTIEEKIYQRQIFKQFLSNKVLEDPKQRRAFQNEGIRELFVLGDEYSDHARRDLKDITNMEVQLMPDEMLEEASAGADAKGAGEESTILKSLMEGDVVTKALCHDKIMMADTGARQPGYQKKATQIAERAAENLRRSQRDCAMNPVNTPTWTGTSGTAGKPQPRRFGTASFGGSGSSRPRFGGSVPVAGMGGELLTSASLLAHIKNRDKEVRGHAEDGEKVAEELMQDVLLYLRGLGGGGATSGALVEHFSWLAKDKGTLFKQILKQVAARQEDGTWKLKPDFVKKRVV